MTNTPAALLAIHRAYAPADCDQCEAVGSTCWECASDALAELAAQAAPARCATHPAYDADYCPACGTTTPIGDR